MCIRDRVPAVQRPDQVGADAAQRRVDHLPADDPPDDDVVALVAGAVVSLSLIHI